MRLTTNSIITLDNKERYLVLNKTIIDNSNYFLVMGIDENNNTISSKVAIFEEVINNNELFITKIENKEMISKIMNELKKEM